MIKNVSFCAPMITLNRLDVKTNFMWKSWADYRMVLIRLTDLKSLINIGVRGCALRRDGISFACVDFSCMIEPYNYTINEGKNIYGGEIKEGR